MLRADWLKATPRDIGSEKKKQKKEFYQKVSPGKSFFTFLLFVEKIKFLDKKRSEIEIELLLGGVASLGSGSKARVKKL